MSSITSWLAVNQKLVYSLYTNVFRKILLNNSQTIVSMEPEIVKSIMIMSKTIFIRMSSGVKCSKNDAIYLESTRESFV